MTEYRVTTVLNLAISQHKLEQWQKHLARLEWLDKALQDTEWRDVSKFASERAAIEAELAQDFVWLLKRAGLHPAGTLTGPVTMRVGSPLEIREKA